MKSSNLAILIIVLIVSLLLISCDEYDDSEPDVIEAKVGVYYFAYDHGEVGEGYFLRVAIRDDEIHDRILGATVLVGNTIVIADTVMYPLSNKYYQYDLDMDSLFAIDDEYPFYISFQDGAEVAGTIRKFELPVIEEFNADTIWRDDQLDLNVVDLGIFQELRLHVSDSGNYVDVKISAVGTKHLDLDTVGCHGWADIRTEVERNGESYRTIGEPILQVVLREDYRDYVTMACTDYP
jgi:hypothetical protein